MSLSSTSVKVEIQFEAKSSGYRWLEQLRVGCSCSGAAALTAELQLAVSPAILCSSQAQFLEVWLPTTSFCLRPESKLWKMTWFAQQVWTMVSLRKVAQTRRTGHCFSFCSKTSCSVDLTFCWRCFWSSDCSGRFWCWKCRSLWKLFCWGLCRNLCCKDWCALLQRSPSLQD